MSSYDELCVCVREGPVAKTSICEYLLIASKKLEKRALNVLVKSLCREFAIMMTFHKPTFF